MTGVKECLNVTEHGTGNGEVENDISTGSPATTRNVSPGRPTRLTKEFDCYH